MAPNWKSDPSWFKPGAVAPRSGIYRAYHYAHRLPHEVFIAEGTVFPICKRCDQMVQFAPLLAGELLGDDKDFQGLLEATA